MAIVEQLNHLNISGSCPHESVSPDEQIGQILCSVLHLVRLIPGRQSRRDLPLIVRATRSDIIQRRCRTPRPFAQWPFGVLDNRAPDRLDCQIGKSRPEKTLRQKPRIDAQTLHG